MKILEVMTPAPETISPEESLQRAAQMMDDLNVGILPVCDGDRLVGVVTDRDIAVRAAAAGRAPGVATVSEAMTEETRCCFEDDDVAAAENVMRNHQLRRIPVIDHDQRLKGIVSLGDLAAAKAEGISETMEDVSQPPYPDR